MVMMAAEKQPLIMLWQAEPQPDSPGIHLDSIWRQRLSDGALLAGRRCQRILKRGPRQPCSSQHTRGLRVRQDGNSLLHTLQTHKPSNCAACMHGLLGTTGFFPFSMLTCAGVGAGARGLGLLQGGHHGLVLRPLPQFHHIFLALLLLLVLQGGPQQGWTQQDAQGSMLHLRSALI